MAVPSLADVSGFKIQAFLLQQRNHLKNSCLQQHSSEGRVEGLQVVRQLIHHGPQALLCTVAQHVSMAAATACPSAPICTEQFA